MAARAATFRASRPWSSTAGRSLAVGVGRADRKTRSLACAGLSDGGTEPPKTRKLRRHQFTTKSEGACAYPLIYSELRMLEPKPGSHEVRGSIPLGSTNEIQRPASEGAGFSRFRDLLWVGTFRPTSTARLTPSHVRAKRSVSSAFSKHAPSARPTSFALNRDVFA